MALTILAPPATPASTVTHTIGIEPVTDALRAVSRRLFPEDHFAVVERLGTLVTILASDSTGGADRAIARKAVLHAQLRGAVLIAPCDYCGVSTCGNRDQHSEWYRANETTVRERWS